MKNIAKRMTAEFFFAVVLLATTLATPAHSSAQVGLPAAVSERCVRSTVQVRVQNQSGTSSGSGTFIDPRGYILTNFHVVGRMFANPPHAAGTLFDPANRVTILYTDSDRSEARPEWIGQVVRGDARLDFALIRIVSRADGSALPPNFTFPFLSPTAATNLRLGAAVFAFGYPLDARTPSVTGGHIEGFQSNAEGAISWIRTDAEFNPGNSGGLLVDDGGNFIGVPSRVAQRDGAISPVEFARPAERMPQSFVEAMASSASDFRVEGIVTLPATGSATIRATGDMTQSNREDFFIVNIPDTRPLTISVPAPHHIALYLGDQFVREAEGTMIVGAYDRPGTSAVIAVILAEGDSVPQPIELTITSSATLPPAPVAASSPQLTREYQSDGTYEEEDEDFESVVLSIGLGLTFDPDLPRIDVAGGLGIEGYINLVQNRHLRLAVGLGLSSTVGQFQENVHFALATPVGLALDLGPPRIHGHVEFNYLPGLFTHTGEPGNVEWIYGGYRIGGGLRWYGGGIIFRYREQHRGVRQVYRELTLNYEFTW